MQVLFLASTRAGMIGYDEEVIAFTVSVLVVEDAFCLLLVAARATALLHVAF